MALNPERECCGNCEYSLQLGADGSKVKCDFTGEEKDSSDCCDNYDWGQIGL